MKGGRAFQREQRLLPLSDACLQHDLIEQMLRTRIEHISLKIGCRKRPPAFYMVIYSRAMSWSLPAAPP